MKKKKKTPKQLYYQEVFDVLADIGMRDRRIPKKLLECWDAVADYFGDVAMGRRK